MSKLTVVQDNTKNENSTTKSKKQITKVLQISREFVSDFCKNASPEERHWVTSTLEKYEQEHGHVKYFAPFRMAFAKKFFPELIAQKGKPKRVSLRDEILSMR